MCDSLVAGHETPDGIHLVLHQGDERGDDDGRPFHDQGRQLVAEGFTASGRHQDEDILTGNEGPDDFLLFVLKAIVSKKILQKTV